jgi:hypothetical protein
MAKKKTKLMIPFNEEGMRTFKDVKTAIKYFTMNGSIPQQKIVALFQSTFQIVSGKYSVNVIDLQKMNAETMKVFLLNHFKVENEESFERTIQIFENEMVKWKDKFKVSDIKQEAVKA